MSISNRTRSRIGSRLSGVARRMEGLSLDLTQTAKSSEGGRYLKFVILDWFKMKIGWLDNVNLEQEMKNLACGYHWILPVVAWPVLRRVENQEISYWQMVSYMSWPCFQGGSGGGYDATGIAICVMVARAITWRSRSSHKSRMGYLPLLMPCWLLRLNTGARGEHLTSQLSWVPDWLLVTRVCPVYLMKERCYIKGVYWSLGGRWAGKGGIVVSWGDEKGVWVEWKVERI